MRQLSTSETFQHVRASTQHGGLLRVACAENYNPFPDLQEFYAAEFAGLTASWDQCLSSVSHTHISALTQQISSHIKPPLSTDGNPEILMTHEDNQRGRSALRRTGYSRPRSRDVQAKNQLSGNLCECPSAQANHWELGPSAAHLCGTGGCGGCRWHSCILGVRESASLLVSHDTCCEMLHFCWVARPPW